MGRNPLRAFWASNGVELGVDKAAWAYYPPHCTSRLTVDTYLYKLTNTKSLFFSLSLHPLLFLYQLRLKVLIKNHLSLHYSDEVSDA